MATKVTKPTVRESAATVFDCGKERPVIVEVHPRTIVLRLKGLRGSHELSIDGLYWRTCQIEAARTDGE